MLSLSKHLSLCHVELVETSLVGLSLSGEQRFFDYKFACKFSAQNDTIGSLLILSAQNDTMGSLLIFSAQKVAKFVN